MARPSVLSRFVALGAIVVLTAACTSDDGVDRQAYVDAVQADLLAPGDGDELPLEEEVAGCVAGAIVDAADPGRLDEADIAPEDFAAAEDFADVDIDADPAQLRADLAAALQDCSLGRPLTDVMVAEFPFELTEDDERCIAEALDGSSELAEGVAGVLVDDQEDALTEALTVGLAACPSAVGDLLAESITEAGFPVDDEARACLTDEIEARGREAIDQILGPDADELGVELAEGCLLG